LFVAVAIEAEHCVFSEIAEKALEEGSIATLQNYTVEPVYNGPILNGHPLLSGQFSKSLFFLHTNAVFVTSIRQSPLLAGKATL